MLRHATKSRAMMVVVAPAMLTTLLAVPWLAGAAGDRQSGVPRKDEAADTSARSRFLHFHAPAGDQPTHVGATLDGRPGAILPNGRFVTPTGAEIDVKAPKPFGLAVARDERTLATINSGATPFSVTLIREPRGAHPTTTRIDVDATFMGVVFSPDGKWFYASGGDNGNLWVGDVDAGKIVGSINLNGAAHPLDRPLSPTATPALRFKGAFPGNLVLTRDGQFLYVVDQAGFQVHAIDTRLIVTGVDAAGAVTEPDNFAAVVGRTRVGRYPFGIALAPDDRTVFVTNVGVFQYAHLRPAAPVGNSNVDYPLCIPGAGYPDETEDDKVIQIKKIDARTISGLPTTLRDPDGIRCGYVAADQSYTVPGLGSPNVPESSSVYVLDVAQRARPVVKTVVRTGRAVGEYDDGIRAYAGSHPNAVVSGAGKIYVSNGNNDTITVLDLVTSRPLDEVSLAVLSGVDRTLKGVEPVSLALAPDGRFLYVAEAGLNAVGVIALPQNAHGRAAVVGHIPVGWWPSCVRVSQDGRQLFVANAKGRGAGPTVDADRSPKISVMGTVNVVSVPTSPEELAAATAQVMRNNGFTAGSPTAPQPGHHDHDHDHDHDHYHDHDRGRDRDGDDSNPIPGQAGVSSRQIKHVIFINKENATHDLLLGDITATRRGVPVDGDPAFSLGVAASPNHHELAQRFTMGDNFFLEPTVSSDGHRWLTNNYTSEIEETHWPASYGGKKRDSGDDAEVIAGYPGRIGFTDADASPEPNDLNEHGGIYAHLVRHGLDFVNFGNGFEFAIVDEDRGTEPTGIREHVNVPMEQIVRQRTDHLFPEFNTAIPDAPLPENPDRFNRFGRFKQVFESHYVDRQRGVCTLPSYVDLYYPNDHGGGAFDINPSGPAWDFTRFVQDNDAALGLTVDLISKSPCWKDTVIFVVEDDTQNGLDHVDGYRSLFLAISPWVKHEHVAKTHLSLASIFKTIDLILGIPPLNQYDAAATDLRDIFTPHPDMTTFDFVQPVYVAKAKRSWRKLTSGINFADADRDEVKLRLAIQRSEGLPRRRGTRR